MGLEDWEEGLLLRHEARRYQPTDIRPLRTDLRKHRGAKPIVADDADHVLRSRQLPPPPPPPVRNRQRKTRTQNYFQTTYHHDRRHDRRRHRSRRHHLQKKKLVSNFDFCTPGFLGSNLRGSKMSAYHRGCLRIHGHLHLHRHRLKEYNFD